MHDLCLADDGVAEVRTEEAGRLEIDATAYDFSEFVLQAEEAEARRATRLEFDQHVDVTVRPEVVAQHRAEERQLADAVAAAELGEAAAIDGELHRHSCDPGRGWVKNSMGGGIRPAQPLMYARDPSVDPQRVR
jgi:hypothetical protein